MVSLGLGQIVDVVREDERLLGGAAGFPPAVHLGQVNTAEV